MPARVAVPLPLSVKVTPDGSAPDSVNAAVGLPVVVTENDPAVPTVKVVEVALVMAGAVGAALTVRVKLWVALRADPVGRRDRDRVAAVGPGRRGAGQGGRAVAVVGEGHPRRQGPGLGERRRRAAGGRHRERPRRAPGEGRRVGAGDGRGLLDGDGEGLLGRAVGVGGRPVVMA